MGLLARIFGETRSAVEQRDVRLSDPYLADFFGFTGRGAVSTDAVMSNLAVAARCVGLRSELMASVGLFLYRRTDDGGRERADDNPLYGVLHDNANENMSAFEAREFLVRMLDTAGNAYARIETNARGQVTAIYPHPSTSVAVDRLPSGRLRYRFAQPRGGDDILLQEEVLHVRGPSRDGMLGQSPIAVSRGALSLALAQNETAASFMGNALLPSGLLSFDQALTPEQREQIRRNVLPPFTGAANSGKVMIMDAGARFTPMSFNPADSEFLSSRKLGNEDVARIFGCPPTSVGITDKATYSNTEQEATALVQNALGPLAKRVEAAMMRCLLTPAARRSYYIEHDLDALLRGDIEARFKAYRIAREIGVMSPNDIRRKENDPPIKNGDIYNQPANWIRLGDTTPMTETPVTAPVVEED